MFPPEIVNYQPADLPNSCMLESVVFADWFMTREFDGPKSWAQAVFITARLQGRKFDHAVALFQLEGKLYLWDVEWGVLPLSIEERSRPPGQTLAEVAERTYGDWLKRAAKMAKQGKAPLPSLRLSRPPGLSVLEWARDRLNVTRPTLMVAGESAAGAFDALSFMVLDRMFVYTPDFGTTASALSGEPKSTLTKILGSMRGGPVSGLRIYDVRTPVEAKH